MEQLNCNLLFRWFVGTSPDDATWGPAVFRRNRNRLIAGHIADAFMAELPRAADERRLLPHEDFTVSEMLLD